MILSIDFFFFLIQFDMTLRMNRSWKQRQSHPSSMPFLFRALFFTQSHRPVQADSQTVRVTRVMQYLKWHDTSNLDSVRIKLRLAQLFNFRCETSLGNYSRKKKLHLIDLVHTVRNLSKCHMTLKFQSKIFLQPIVVSR